MECLKQKKVLLEKIMEMSSQMESLSKLPHPDPGTLPQEREVYIDRLKKCNQLIDSHVNRLSSSGQTRVNYALSSNLKKTDCTPEEFELSECGAACRSLLRDIVATDQVSMERFREESHRLQKFVNQSRQKQNGSMFYNSAR